MHISVVLSQKLVASHWKEAKGWQAAPGGAGGWQSEVPGSQRSPAEQLVSRGHGWPCAPAA